MYATMFVNKLKVVSESIRTPQFFVFLFLGFAAGLPYMLVFSTLSYWLAEADINRKLIGLLSLVSLPYTLKWIWAPLLDRYRINFFGVNFGRRRSWLICTQIGLILMILFMSFQDPNQSVIVLAACALCLAFFSATQDALIDGFRIDVAEQDDQALLAASYLIGYRFAMIMASAGALLLADFFANGNEAYTLSAWQSTYQVLAVMMMIGLVTTFFAAEPTNIAKESKTLSFIESFITPFRDFFQRFHWKHALLIAGIVATYRLSDIVLGVMANPFYVDVGFTKTQVAAISKVYGVIMVLVGAAVGGLLAHYFGTLKVLFLGGLLSAVTNILFAQLSVIGPNTLWLTGVISMDNLSAGIATSSFIAFLSNITNKEFSATQYAVLSSVMLLFPKFLGGSSGVMVTSLGYEKFFYFTALMGIPALVLIVLLSRSQWYQRQD